MSAISNLQSTVLSKAVTVGTSFYCKNLRIMVKMYLFSLSRSSELILLWYSCGTKAGGDCKIAAPINFIRGISAGKMDSFRLDFVSVSDKRGPVINDHL